MQFPPPAPNLRSSADFPSRRCARLACPWAHAPTSTRRVHPAARARASSRKSEADTCRAAPRTRAAQGRPYLTVGRACGFALKSEGNLLRTFAAFADAQRAQRLCGHRHRMGRIDRIGLSAGPQARRSNSLRPACPRRGRAPRSATTGIWHTETAAPGSILFTYFSEDEVRLRISGKVNARFGEVEQAGGRCCVVYGL
jgi:hypothetical protein